MVTAISHASKDGTELMSTSDIVLPDVLQVCGIWGSHNSGYEESYLLGHNAM
jgi:hypothetical protein